MGRARGKSIRLDGATAQAFMQSQNDPKTMEDVYLKTAMGIHLAMAEGKVELAKTLVATVAAGGAAKLRSIYHLEEEQPNDGG